MNFGAEEYTAGSCCHVEFCCDSQGVGIEGSKKSKIGQLGITGTVVFIGQIVFLVVFHPAR